MTNEETACDADAPGPAAADGAGGCGCAPGLGAPGEEIHRLPHAGRLARPFQQRAEVDDRHPGEPGRKLGAGVRPRRSGEGNPRTVCSTDLPVRGLFPRPAGGRLLPRGDLRDRGHPRDLASAPLVHRRAQGDPQLYDVRQAPAGSGNLQPHQLRDQPACL